MSEERSRPIAIAGAGVIGCFAGGLLAAAGRDVVLLGRAGAMADIAQDGLRITDLDGLDCHLPPAAIRIASDPAALSGCGTVLVTVKSAATAEMAGLIAQHAPADAVVISLQNGVANPRILREALPGRTVLAGIVPYSVTRLAATHLHRGSSGRLLIQPGAPDLVERLSVPGLKMVEEPEIEALQWGKLLINLNNGLNALSGLPLRDQLLTLGWRRLLAAQIDEAQAVLKIAHIEAKAPLRVPIALLPAMLRLPTPMFGLLARRMLPMDPKARSSMWDDLQRRRPTEIDALQGEVLVLAKRYGLSTPVIAEVTALIRQAEAAQAGPPGLKPDQVIGVRTLLNDRYRPQKR
jgi:2-dehydropantoate 2-reductase